MTAPKKQHYVPQFYLRKFLDPIEESKGQNILWLYEQDRFPSRQSVKEVGYEEYFYDIGPDSAALDEVKQPGYMEQALHKLEDVAIPPFEKLASGEIDLTPQLKGEFAGFISLAMCRTPHYIDTLNRTAVTSYMASLRYWQANPDVLEKLSAEAGAEQAGVPLEELRTFIDMVLKTKMEPVQQDKAFTLLHMFKGVDHHMDTLEQMRWSLVASPSDEYFITCDSPVFFRDPNFKPGGELKWSEAAYFVFPISRRFVLFGDFVKGPDLVRTASVKELIWTRALIVARAQKQVYAPYKDDALREQVNKMHSQRTATVETVPDQFFYDHFDKYWNKRNKESK